jgi:hypothetical protein
MITINEFAAASLSRPRGETPLQKLENQARLLRNNGARASAEINGHLVEVRLLEAMINRGMATGTCDRFTYYLDGKRTAYGKVWDAVCK